VALATVVPVISFIIFETWFLVPMPKGPVEAWIGY
jgi:putative tricarboxylic transport membrane protein